MKRYTNDEGEQEIEATRYADHHDQLAAQERAEEGHYGDE